MQVGHALGDIKTHAKLSVLPAEPRPFLEHRGQVAPRYVIHLEKMKDNEQTHSRSALNMSMSWSYAVAVSLTRRRELDSECDSMNDRGVYQ